jgi:peptidoglycan/LPS O-acetylase OafA/YrhL
MGAIRLFLAFAVMLEHFNQQVLGHRDMHMDLALVLNVSGGRAVLFFYIVSGFLMSFVLHEKYEPTRAGTNAFYRSRFLRIYPLWWTILAFCFLLYWLGANEAVPSNPIPSISLLGLDWIVSLRLFPSLDWSPVPNSAAIAWTLGAEITFYLMAPWVLRSKIAASVLLIGSAAIRAMIFLTLTRGSPGYANLTMFFFPATLMFFLLGHFGAVIARQCQLNLFASLLFLIASAALSYYAENPVSVDGWPAHLSAICFALALPGIFHATKNSRVFNVLGDLTYPLYLTHSLVIAALFWPLAFASGLGERTMDSLLPLVQSKVLAGILLTGTFIIIAIAVTAVVHYCIERPSRRIFAAIIDTIAAFTREARTAVSRQT